jgi:hypothetical protein
MLGFGVCGDLVEAAGRTVEDEGTAPPAADEALGSILNQSVELIICL